MYIETKSRSELPLHFDMLDIRFDKRFTGFSEIAGTVKVHHRVLGMQNYQLNFSLPEVVNEKRNNIKLQ